MNKQNEKQGTDQRRQWKQPTLRSVVPATRTRGGGGNANDQDDIFYDAS